MVFWKNHMEHYTLYILHLLLDFYKWYITFNILKKKLNCIYIKIKIPFSTIAGTNPPSYNTYNSSYPPIYIPFITTNGRGYLFNNSLTHPYAIWLSTRSNLKNFNFNASSR